ncbi:MAG TPA: cytochrome c [Steroidobacteraceae bacterium]|nr:cytochrome c [Steroidobacteraceae bacterium]
MMHKITLIASALALCGSVTALAAEPELGERVYQRWCVHCHSAGRGNPGTQSLQVKYGNQKPAVLLDRTDLTPEFVAFSLRQGVMSMPPFRKTEITDEELAAVSKWVASGGGKR